MEFPVKKDNESKENLQENIEDELTLLVKSAISGDRVAIEKIIEMTKADLYRFCIFLSSDKNMAEDICQEVYVKVFKNLKSLNKPQAFKGWLFKLAKNLYIDLLRKAYNKKETFGIEDVISSHASNPDFELMIQIEKTLKELSVEDRLVILMIYLEGNNYEEAAEILGITESAVKSRAYRARREFIKIFSKF